jgi:putative oxidoreductase
MSCGPLLLRVVAGGTMTAHGAQKPLGWFDGPGLGGVRKMLGSFGFRVT